LATALGLRKKFSNDAQIIVTKLSRASGFISLGQFLSKIYEVRHTD
jgi:hypothetical protein